MLTLPEGLSAQDFSTGPFTLTKLYACFVAAATALLVADLLAKMLLALQELVAWLVAGPVFVGAAAWSWRGLATVAADLDCFGTWWTWSRMAQHKAGMVTGFELVALLITTVGYYPWVELGVLHLFTVAVIACG